MTQDVTTRLNTVLLNVEKSEKELANQIAQGKAGVEKALGQITTLESHLADTRALKMLLIAASADGALRERVEGMMGNHAE
jgi:hypothetical protein